MRSLGDEIGVPIEVYTYVPHNISTQYISIYSILTVLSLCLISRCMVLKQQWQVSARRQSSTSQPLHKPLLYLVTLNAPSCLCWDLWLDYMFHFLKFLICIHNKQQVSLYPFLFYLVCFTFDYQFVIIFLTFRFGYCFAWFVNTWRLFQQKEAFSTVDAKLDHYLKSVKYVE